eukprot:1181504-Prorocentrum_minimum.AAC.4
MHMRSIGKKPNRFQRRDHAVLTLDPPYPEALGCDLAGRTLRGARVIRVKGLGFRVFMCLVVLGWTLRVLGLGRTRGNLGGPSLSVSRRLEQVPMVVTLEEW